MPVRHRVSKRFAVALISLSAAFALSITLLGCGVSSTAKEFSWASGSKTAATGLYGLAAISNPSAARFNWTSSSENASAAQTYAFSATEQLNHFWEFIPATEQWSWVNVSGAKDPMYVADMPELTPTDNAWTWVNGTTPASATYSLAATSNLSGDLYSWIGSSPNAFPAGEYASNASGRSHFWEFNPATEMWSWASGSSTQEPIYVASMPELTSTDNAWTWVNGSNTLGAGGSYDTRGVIAVNNVPGARCATVDWVESASAPSRCVGDELQASLNDFYRYGP